MSDESLTIEQFNYQFIKRHDFNYYDALFLSKKYKGIKFINIPEAWVCEIDFKLSKIKKLSSIKSLSQIMGFIIIETKNNILKHDLKIINMLDNRIKSIDIDLHNQLKEGIILN